MKKDFKRFFLTWIVLFIVIEVTMSAFGIGKKDDDIARQQEIADGVIIEAMKDEIAIGKEVIINIENWKSEEITILNESCQPTFNVFRYTLGVWEEIKIPAEENCIESGGEPTILQTGDKASYSFLKWNYDLFGEMGRYKVSINFDREYTSPEFTIKKKGLFKRGWDFFFHKPIYNALIFFTDINPKHSLGVAIILLTLLIRVILLIPSQKALRSQKKMQEIQPKIQEIQRKYKGNQERIAMETMALWKSAKTNPLGSCLPILFQFPILIGLYYSVRDVVIGAGVHNLYEFQKDFDFDSIHTMFLNTLDLAEKNIIVLPIIIGLLQFSQMKLTFAMKKTPKKKESKKKDDKKSGTPDMQAMNRTMTYTMPLMIAFFTATLPAGVGLYWGTSTLFAIGQTLVINREKPKDGIVVKNSEEVTVRVVDKSEDTEREAVEKIKKKYLPKGKKKKK